MIRQGTERLLGALDQLARRFPARKFIPAFLGMGLLLVSLTIYTEIFHHIQFYKEGQPMTLVSFGQLLLCGALAWFILQTRLPQTRGLGLKEKLRHLYQPASVWLILALGFLFLALDELLMIHEILDKALHFLLSIKETALTDHLDDVIILGYLILGGSILAIYTTELWHFRRSMPYWGAALALVVAMSALDILTGDKALVSAWLESHPLIEENIFNLANHIGPEGFTRHFQINETAKFLFNLTCLIEEGCKVMAGACFSAGFFSAYEHARHLGAARTEVKPTPSIQRSAA